MLIFINNSARRHHLEENLKDDSLRSEKVGYSGHMCDPRELRESWLQEGELALKGGLQTQSHYQPVRLDRDVAKIREWVQWTRASRPISEVLVPYICAQSPGTRPAWSVGPLGARPKPMCLGLCCRASRAELLLAFVYFISIFG